MSRKCYEPRNLVDGWIRQRVANLSSTLDVFYNTVVVNSTTTTTASASPGTAVATVSVTGLVAVQRTPVASRPAYTRLLSSAYPDWCSPQPSSFFTKQRLHFTGPATAVLPVLVDASETGDVLVTAGLAYAQGVEAPLESSSTTLSGCGQASVLPFYMKAQAVSSSMPGLPHMLPLYPPMPKSAATLPPYSFKDYTWDAVRWRVLFVQCLYTLTPQCGTDLVISPCTSWK